MTWGSLIVATVTVLNFAALIWLIERSLDQAALIRYLLKRDGNQWIATLPRQDLNERETSHVRYRP